MIININKSKDWEFRIVWGIPDKNMVVRKCYNQYFKDKVSMDKKNRELIKEGFNTTIFSNENNNDYIGIEINAY